jgi:3-dehydroquinate synthetase
MIAVLEAAQHILGENHQESISRLKKILTAAGLPIKIPETVNYTEMIDLILKDKKKTEKNDVIDFVLI